MFFLVVVAVIFVMSVFFRVSDIQVRGNSHYSDEEIIRAIDIEEGDNLFFFDRFAALSRVFAKLPYIDEVSVERSLPNKVIITVSESQALAYIVLGEEKWTIDHSCKVLGKANDDELQGLIPIEGISPGTLMIGEPLERPRTATRTSSPTSRRCSISSRSAACTGRSGASISPIRAASPSPTRTNIRSCSGTPRTWNTNSEMST